MADLIRILVVDDQPLVRAGLTMVLGGQPDLQVVGEAGDGEQALTQAAALRPHVVLMDIRMPRLDGVAATARLTTSGADPTAPKVIVLTTFDLDDFVVGAVAAGASGFLLKDTDPAQIVEAVRRVHDGEPMLSPSVTAQLMRRVAVAAEPGPAARRHDAATARIATLTEREREVAVAVGQGLSNAEIAQRLHLSVATVKAHVSHLLDKLGAANRVQVAITVHDAGLA